MIRRGLYRSVGVLLGLAMTVLLLVTALLASPEGSRWLIERAVVYAPGTVVIRRIDGSLLSGLVVSGINYRQDGMSLHVGRVELVINPAGVLHGRIILRRLAIEDANYRAPAADADTRPFSLPERIVLPR